MSTDLDDSIFILDEIRYNINNEEWEAEGYDGALESRRVFLGTCFDLLPSGKYMANDPRDEIWVNEAEYELESIGLSLEAGEGDPCDMFAVEYRDAEVCDDNDDSDLRMDDSCDVCQYDDGEFYYK
jgi:hypothetical protein